MYGKSPAKAGIYPLSFPAKLHNEEGELYSRDASNCSWAGSAGAQVGRPRMKGQL